MTKSYGLAVGVRKGLKPYQIVISVLLGVSILSAIVCGCILLGDYDTYEMAENGVEVEAHIVDVQRVRVDTDDSWYYTWRSYYEYVAPDGVSYSGVYGSHSSKEAGEKYIGESVTITINPLNGKSSVKPLSQFVSHREDIYRDFTLFCALCGGFLVILCWFLYRVAYRKIIDGKILKYVRCAYVGTPISDGEIVRCIGLFWFYVKVRYYDDGGIAHEKWARELFSRREAAFLTEKQFINIVRYKNTYGILEKMPVTIK